MAQFGLTLYACDAQFDRHLAQTTAVAHPTFHALQQMSWDDIWLRPVDVQVTAERVIYGEEFGMILDDLRALPKDRPILAEGAALLPELVAPLLPRPSQACYLVPTPAFQHAHYARREWTADILAQTCDPETAYANWMARDVAFGRAVLADARRLGLPALEVDGTRSIPDTAVGIARQFNLRQILDKRSMTQ